VTMILGGTGVTNFENFRIKPKHTVCVIHEVSSSDVRSLARHITATFVQFPAVNSEQFIKLHSFTTRHNEHKKENALF
jgi:hypothetical protein